jgi:hypothetical protein
LCYGTPEVDSSEGTTSIASLAEYKKVDRCEAVEDVGNFSPCPNNNFIQCFDLSPTLLHPYPGFQNGPEYEEYRSPSTPTLEVTIYSPT